ncbi:hypothetical protein Tco_0569419 [Tanacetum coccineum]
MEKAGHQVSLLEATRERVVPLSPLVPVNATSSEGNMTESIDRLFDEANGVEKEHSTGGGEYVALTEAIVEHVYEDVAEKPMRLKKKRKATGDASGSTLPSKKLRDDYGTSGASASTGGKSRAAMQSLLDNSKLVAEIEVTAAATVPLVTSFMTPTPERKGCDHTDSVSGTNLRTKPAAVRFVISSDSSHHFGTHAVDVEVSSLVRSTVLDPPMMTTAVTTTAAAVETYLVSVSKVKVKPINPTLFGDSMSTSGHDVAGPSSSVHPKLFADSFYAIQDLNLKTLHRLAPPALFSQLRAMEYDQLYTKFNVGAARQTCLGVEVRIRAEHTLRKNKILAEAIRLRGHVATVEATEALHAAELNLLKKRNSTLEAKMRASEENAAALEFEESGLTDQVSLLETTCVELRNQVAGYELFKEKIKAVQDEQVRVLTEKIAEVDAHLMRMALQLDDEFYPSYLTTIARRRWILSHGLKLVVTKCLQLPEYLSVLGKAIGPAVDKGIDVAAYNPSADADYVVAVSALCDVDFSLLTLLASQKDASISDIIDYLHLEGPAAETPDAGGLQPSHEQFMLLIHRTKDNVVLGETSLYFSLKFIHNRIQRIRGDVEARRLSLFDVMVPLIEPLSSENLLGEASTSGVPVTADVVTTLSTTFAQSVSVSVPPLLVADYQVVQTRPQVEDPSSGGIVFEKEELETSPEPVAGS